ncbi:MAG: DinB family protein [Flavobacterium sp.]|uniref:DinB family protein n=1 Tax=Flavobacterium sp. TaxID=239 RepID=UPI003BCA0045
MHKLLNYVKELESKIPNQEDYNPEISKSNVGWHIEHILLTNKMILEAVEKSNPADYTWSFKLPRIVVFTMNKIPRGRAKAPKVVVPKTYDEQTLLEHLKIVTLKIQGLENMSSDKYFDHPYFGNLRLNKTIKFLEIHTNHHLEIINDILK